MITIQKEPHGLLLKKNDVLAWCDGLTESQWDKIRTTLTPVRLPGCKKPFYRKTEIQRKIINPMLETNERR